MKKIILPVLIIATISLQAHAQKNTLLLYGDIGFSADKAASGAKQTAISFSPGLGYQWNNNWTAGGNISIGATKYSSPGSQTSKGTSLKIGPFIRYTKMITDIFGIYGQGNVSYFFSKQ